MLALLTLSGCATRPPSDWTAFDVLRDPPPPAAQEIRGVKLSPEDYEQLREWGEAWFRHGGFGSERAVTDVMGILAGEVEVPCGPGSPEGCTRTDFVFPRVLRAVDTLDGTAGNLFRGNGGLAGTGYTSDLVLEFPPGTRMFGTIPVPERLHTGLDVEVGEVLPIGIDAVPAPPQDQALAYLPDLSRFGYDGAPSGRVRLRLACAACHYSLDIDADGKADVRSARSDQPTPGSAFAPEDAWGVGNQDLSFGWLFALSANPLFGAPVLSGAVGTTGPAPAIAFMKWVRAHYKESPVAVTREVVASMLAQPRGYADVTTDGVFNTIQIPALYTRHAWPSNSDGSQSNGTDRNNTVWTGALDFTGLIGLCSDRGSSIHLPWEPATIFQSLPCADFADLMTRYSPAVRWEPSLQEGLVADILGTTDGTPGMLDPGSTVVMRTSTYPKALVETPYNVDNHRIRTASDFGGAARFRRAGMAALGVRIAVEPQWRVPLARFVQTYGLDLEDLTSEAVSIMLDWMEPPANRTALLANAASLVPRGRQVFQDAGCDSCHRGPFGTDNLIHEISADPVVEFGRPRVPTTAGWRVLDRGDGPPIDTEPQRTVSSRALRRFVSPPYDPATGVAVGRGGVLPGFLSAQKIGYKTTALRYLWGSAPYLHDGGVGVALRPGAPAAGDDLQALLARADGRDLLYGMGDVLSLAEGDPSLGLRPQAALSLQALVLEKERHKVIVANEQPRYAVWPGSARRIVGEGPPLERVPIATLGVHGEGHPFWVVDVAGGEKVTALVAYLLALDDCPRDLPGAPQPCPRYQRPNPRPTE
jgi:hypothetical protein